MRQAVFFNVQQQELFRFVRSFDVRAVATTSRETVIPVLLGTRVYYGHILSPPIMHTHAPLKLPRAVEGGRSGKVGS